MYYSLQKFFSFFSFFPLARVYNKSLPINQYAQKCYKLYWMEKIKISFPVITAVGTKTDCNEVLQLLLLTERTNMKGTGKRVRPASWLRTRCLLSHCSSCGLGLCFAFLEFRFNKENFQNQYWNLRMYSLMQFHLSPAPPSMLWMLSSRMIKHSKKEILT